MIRKTPLHPRFARRARDGAGVRAKHQRRRRRRIRTRSRRRRRPRHPPTEPDTAGAAGPADRSTADAARAADAAARCTRAAGSADAAASAAGRTDAAAACAATAGCTGVRVRSHAPDSISSNYKVDWSALDKNGDGNVSRSEVRASGNEDLMREFHVVDGNHNGRLSKEEMKGWLQ